MPSAVLTPFTRYGARPAGERRWRKKLLPIGDVHYEGRVLKFSKDYLADLARAFKDRAYDYVPFQLAGDANKHTNDVERYGGRISDMGLDMQGPDGPGLYMDLMPTERGEKVLRDNPDVGVSARIVEDYERSDRRFFPAAIQHVLATHDPRIPGLGGWQAIEVSNDGVTATIDLSGAQFAGETEGTGAMPELTAEQHAKMAKLLDIPAEQFDQLIAGLSAPALTDAQLDVLNGDGSEGELSDAELDELLAAAAELDGAGLLAEPQPAGAGAQLSSDMMLALELTNARADHNEQQLAKVQEHLDKERFQAEQRRFLDMGIPADIVQEAKPLLFGSGHIVDLANGQGVDAGAVMRKVLGRVGDLHRSLGLEIGVELGSPMDEPTQYSQAAASRADTIAAFRAQTGL